MQEWEEAQRLEVEALQSLYPDDVVILSTVPSIVPSKAPLPSALSITILPEPLLDRTANNHAVLTMRLSYSPLAVPLLPPCVELQVVRGVTSEQLAVARRLVEAEKQRMWLEDVRHDGIMVSLCGVLQEWLRGHNVENVSFHEQMKRREQQEEEERERERLEREKRAAREERERRERLAMEIEQANRRMERAMHEEKRLRQQQQHGAAHTKAIPSQAVSPLPATQTVKRSSSEEKKEQPRAPAESNVREVKVKLAQARAQEKKLLQRERNAQRSGKEHRTHAKDNDVSTSNPAQWAEDKEGGSEDESDDGEEEEEEGEEESSSSSEDEKEEDGADEQEDVDALFPSSFNLSGSLSFFDQKKRNERELLAELDNRGARRSSVVSSSSSEEEDESEDDSESVVGHRGTPKHPKRRLLHTSPGKLKPLTSSTGAASDQPALAVSLSRYRSDFEELQLLGKGGFGSVYKVRGRVDKLLYAVKRIKLKRRGAEENRRIVREVSTIGMLHHSYIVRYYQAWIEEEDERERGKAGDEWRLEDEQEAGSDWLSSSNHTSSYLRELDDDEDGPDEKEGRSSRRNSDKSNRPSQCLYIQMEYCQSQHHIHRLNLLAVVSSFISRATHLRCLRRSEQDAEGCDSGPAVRAQYGDVLAAVPSDPRGRRVLAQQGRRAQRPQARQHLHRSATHQPHTARLHRVDRAVLT